MPNSVTHSEAYLRCTAVGSSYPDGSEALREVKFSLRRGERVALIGPNGAGKSTLLRAIVGVQPFTGDIVVGGTALTPSTAPNIREQIGLVFQNPDDQLFSPTVGQDIAFGPAALGLSKADVRIRTEEALAQVGLEHAADLNPVHLSFGERRRAAIATVLSMRPALLAMDEPASNLDPLHRRRLIDWLNDQPVLTLLLASHDLDMVAETCDRVLLLSRGIVADAPARDILSDTALLARHGLEPPLGMQPTRFRQTDSPA